MVPNDCASRIMLVCDAGENCSLPTSHFLNSHYNITNLDQSVANIALVQGKTSKTVDLSSPKKVVEFFSNFDSSCRTVISA